VASSNIEQALYVRLTGDTDITDDLDNRIYLARAKSDTPMPYLVYNVVSDPHDAFAFVEINTGAPRIQISIWSEDRYEALRIAQNVRERVRHYSGTWDGMTIHRCTAEGTRLLSEPDRDVFQASFDIFPMYVDAS
jgi:hypothetical protein